MARPTTLTPDPSNPPAWLDSMKLPRLVVKPTAEVGYQLSGGATVVTKKASKLVGIIVLVLFSPLLAMLFVLVGVVAAVALLFPAGRRKWRAQIAKWRNPLRVEIDREHLAPGETASGAVFLQKAGDIQSLSVHVVCEESASYTRGTDRYTDKHRVLDVPVYEAPDPRSGRGEGGRHEFSFKIPDASMAMHSFAATNNSVQWYIEVRRQYPSAAEIKESFGLMVYPLDVCAALLGSA